MTVGTEEFVLGDVSDAGAGVLYPGLGAAGRDDCVGVDALLTGFGTAGPEDGGAILPYPGLNAAGPEEGAGGGILLPYPGLNAAGPEDGVGTGATKGL